MLRTAHILLQWYDRCGRDLPWRHTRDPYRIWLSEVILQQTRIAQGTDYYLRFIERFPTVAALAAASEDEVLRLWQGLGYYSRARNLLAAARAVVERFEGTFPRTPEELRRLPGVGDYTAAAVCSAAYDTPCAAVDGNVYRVLSRLFDIDTPIDTAAGKRTFAALADELLDRKRPGACNQALMDFGALVCTPAKSGCDACPLAAQCLSLGAGTVAARPVKRGATKIRDRWFHYLHILCQGNTVLCRRGPGDIWQGLYEFPLIESDGPLDFAEVASAEAFRLWVGPHWALLRSTDLPPHRLSHQRLHATVHAIEVPALTAAAAAHAVPAERTGDCAVPRPIERYLESAVR